MINSIIYGKYDGWSRMELVEEIEMLKRLLKNISK